MNASPLIIMPVKDSILTAEAAICAIVESGFSLTVYDDFSTPETAQRLDALAAEKGIRVMHLQQVTQHPSPNYGLVLQMAQQEALRDNKPLIIIESDVVVAPNTIAKMQAIAQAGGGQKATQKAEQRPIGLIAAVTHDQQGRINFPYEYARKLRGDVVATRKRLSFCCTWLSLALLQKMDFQTLNPKKNWYDVFISHQATRLGFTNLLMLNNPVLHTPHSSRPWKQLKYSHPIKYYFLKMLHGRDKI